VPLHLKHDVMLTLFLAVGHFCFEARRQSADADLGGARTETDLGREVGGGPAFLIAALLRRRKHPSWLRYALSASSMYCTSTTAGARYGWSRAQALPGRPLRCLATTSDEKCGLNCWLLREFHPA